MGVPRFQPVVLGLLYHVSMEDKYKSMFTYTDCVQRIYEMLTRVQVCWSAAADHSGGATKALQSSVGDSHLEQRRG